MSQTDLTVLIKDDPFSDRPPRLIKTRAGVMVSEIVDMAGFEPLERELACASINGEEIPAELWAQTPARGYVQVVVVPEGGDEDGNKILRAVLTIAVLIAAFYLGPALGAALGFTAEATALAVGSAIITTVGQLAINAIVPPPSFEAFDPPDPIYFIEGQRNRLTPFQPLQAVIGTHRLVPKLVARPYPEIRGDDTYYYLIVEYGPLGVEVSDRRIGDTPLSGLDGVVYQERLVASDPAPTMASRQVIPNPVGALLGDADWEGRRTPANTIDCDIILTFPEGLGKVSKKGKPESNSIVVRVRYREVLNPGPSETFGQWTFASVAQNTTFPPFRGFGQYFSALDGTSYTATTSASGLFTFTATKPQQPFFRQIGFSFPSASTYEVEVQRASTDRDEARVFDDVKLQTILSKLDDPPVLRDDVAWGVYRFKGSDETSGAIDELNMIVKRLVPRFGDTVLDQLDLSTVTASDLASTGPTSNMWEHILWAQRNGFGDREPVADENINWPSFAIAAKDARDRGLSFDYVVQRNVEIDELSNLMAAAGEGRVLFENNKLTARLDRPQPAPTHVFRDGTVRNVSFSKTFPIEVHGYRVTFNDAANGYRTREITVYVDGYTQATATKIEKFPITGKTNWDDVIARVTQAWRNSRLQTENCLCEVPVEAVDNTLKKMSWVSLVTRIITDVRASGIIRALTTSGSNVTAIELDQEAELGPAAGALGLKWVHTDSAGDTTISPVAGLVTPGSDGRTLVVTLTSPVPITGGPVVGDDYVIGPAGDDIYEGLLADAEPAGDGWLRLSLKQYAPERFDESGLTIPGYTAEPVLPLGSQPPAPAYVSHVANTRQMVVNFTLPDGYAGTIRELRVWRAFAPPATDPFPNELSLFEPLSPLGADERQVIDAPGAVDDRIVYRVQAVSDTGRLSPMMETPILTVADILPDMLAFAAVPGVELGASGVIQPILNISFTPETDLVIAGVVIEMRRVALDGGGARLAEGSQPAYQEVAQISHRVGAYVARALVPGGTYDVRAYFTGTRGEVGVFNTLLDLVMLAGSVGPINWTDVFGPGLPEDNATFGADISQGNLFLTPGNAASEADVLNWMLVNSRASLLPNYDFAIAGPTGKPAGLAVSDSANDSQMEYMTSGEVATAGFSGRGLRILGAPDNTVTVSFAAIPIDDRKTYAVYIRDRSSVASANGLYLRFEERQTQLASGDTHINGTNRNSFVNLLNNGPMPGTSATTQTFIYTPTLGTKFASFSMYNWSAFVGAYEVDFVAVSEQGAHEIGADVTANSVPTLGVTASSAVFTADYTGALDAGQAPRIIGCSRRLGGADVSSTTTWSIVAITGCAATIDNTASSAGGTLTVTAVSNSGSITVRSVRDGVTLETSITITKTLSPPPPPPPGSAGTLVQDSTFGSVSSTSLVAISDEMTVTTGPSGQIAFTAPLTCTPNFGAPAGAWEVALRWRIKPVGGSYSYVSAEAASAPDPYTSFESEFGSYLSQFGLVDSSPTDTGLSASTDYVVQLMARRTNLSDGAKTVSFIGTASAQGS